VKKLLHCSEVARMRAAVAGVRRAQMLEIQAGSERYDATITAGTRPAYKKILSPFFLLLWGESFLGRTLGSGLFL
jgi:hypothetical protein